MNNEYNRIRATRRVKNRMKFQPERSDGKYISFSSAFIDGIYVLNANESNFPTLGLVYSIQVSSFFSLTFENFFSSSRSNYLCLVEIFMKATAVYSHTYVLINFSCSTLCSFIYRLVHYGFSSGTEYREIRMKNLFFLFDADAKNLMF